MRFSSIPCCCCCCCCQQGVTAKVQARKAGQRYQHPYDIGFCGNLHAVLGANVLSWLWPLPATAESSGTCFPVGIDPF